MTAVDLVDLNQSSQHRSERRDVCVIGAGAAGIYIAAGLAARGLDVILVEAGDFTATRGDALIGSDVSFPLDVYQGAIAGRYFGVGGTTTQWGGLLIPHTKRDVRQAGHSFDPWAHIVGVVEQHQGDVLHRLGWRTNDFTVDAADESRDGLSALAAAGFDVVSGLMLPFARKNFTWLLNGPSTSQSRITLAFNAVVTKMQPGDGGHRRVQTLQARSAGGNQLEVSADKFVVAAGAIESARILLELDRSAAGPVIRPGAATGRFLADHLSVPIAVVSSRTRRDAIRLFGPRFENGWMRIFRFLQQHPPIDGPRSFAHFSFDMKGPGFTITREFLAAIQGRRRPRVRLRDLGRGFADIARLGFHRFARRRLYVRPESEVELQLDLEQAPSSANRVTLGGDTDAYGRNTVQIHWQIGDRDRQNIASTARRFLDSWPQQPSFPELTPIAQESGERKPHDAYHPVGTCRLGRDAEAVVDENLRVWGLENLWVVSTGVLPSAGTANPTFTSLCLAERLVGQLAMIGLPVHAGSDVPVHA